MKISIIAAVSQNNVIGDGKGLLWHIPGDLPRFKQITMGHHILMGRKTFESIGKVLPGRTSLILCFDKGYKVPGAYVFDDPEHAVKFAKDHREKELMIIGGGMIYKYFLPLADKIYLTKVLKDYEGSVTFPEIKMEEWNEKIIEKHPETDPPYGLSILERK
jgi:dihydrofolate reductase